MRKIYLINLVFILISILNLNGQNINFEWAISVGNSSDDYGASSVLDSSGNIYITGYYTGTVDFNPGVGTDNLTSLGEEDVFVLKLNPNGEFLWAKSFGSSGYDLATDIEIDSSGNVYVTGSFYNTVDFDPDSSTYNLTFNGEWDIFLLKLDTNGNFSWAHNIGGSASDLGKALVLDSGSVYLTGELYVSSGELVDMNPGLGTDNLTVNGCNDIFVQKFDSSGNFIWVKQLSGAGCESPNDITVDASGNLYITGFFSNTVDFDPGPGITNLSPNLNSDVFIEKLDSNGNLIWVKAFTGLTTGTDDFGYQSNVIKVDSSDNIIISGSYSGTVDFNPGTAVNSITTSSLGDIYIVKLDGAGNFSWVKSMGNDNPSNYSSGQDILIDNIGNLFTTGDFQGTIDFNPNSGVFNMSPIGDQNAFVQKLDPNGNFIWANSIGGNNTWCSGNSINRDSSNNLILIGGFAGTVDFDPTNDITNLTAGGFRDFFIQKSSLIISSENIIWGSDSEDYINYSSEDNDGDTFGWKTQNGNISGKGLIEGTSFFSESYDATEGALTPDNLLITPPGEINIPNNVSSITFKLNVEASSSVRPAENFAVYVFDEAIGQSFDTKIYEETLSVGGTGTAKDITATIPISFAGKNIGIIVRHFDCTGQDKLYVDDFEVSYESSTLSSENKIIQSFILYPNPTSHNIYVSLDTRTTFEIVNINGQVLQKGNLHKGENSIDISRLLNGLYFLNLKTEQGLVSKKIIKE